MTLYTSDTNRYNRTALIYLLAAVVCAAFGAVYEHFSFGVYSYFMIYAFAFPLVGGALPALCVSLFRPDFSTWWICEALYHCAVATFTVGSIIQGVLQIYGTTNVLTCVYWYVGTSALIAALLLQLLRAVVAVFSKPSV